MRTKDMDKNKTGRLAQLTGAALDVQFDSQLPALLNARETNNHDNRLVLEAAQHLREVRTPALFAARNWCMEVADTGRPQGVTANSLSDQNKD